MSSSSPAEEVLFEIATRLGREHASAGNRFRVHWEEHIQRSREMILQGADRVTSPDSVTILGGGAAYNIPIAELARRFRVVRLIDIDRDGLAEVASALPAELAGKLEVHLADVAGGVAVRLIAAALEILRTSANSEEALSKLVPLFSGEGLDMTPDHAQVDAWSASYIVSSGLSSQMTIFPERAVIEAFQKKFDKEIEDDFLFKNGSFRLRHEWVLRHGQFLSSLVAPNGRVYWADTVAETPYLQEFGPAALAGLIDAVMIFLDGAYLKTFLTDAGKEVLAERFGKGRPGDELLRLFKDKLDLEDKRRVTWAIMTLVGENLIAAKKELELVKYLIREAERMVPLARQPMLEGGLARFFPSSLEPDRDMASWMWINDPEGAVTLNGSSYYVEAQILRPTGEPESTR